MNVNWMNVTAPAPQIVGGQSQMVRPISVTTPFFIDRLLT
jgi:hypothetical protein